MFRLLCFRGAILTFLPTNSALAQESMSATSLGRPSPPPQKERLRTKFSFGRLRPEHPTAPLPPSPMLSSARNPTPSRYQYIAPGMDPSTPRSSSSNSYEHPTPSTKDAVHPYANPDLVISYVPEQVPSSPFQNSNFLPSRSDSTITVTETTSADSMPKSSAWSSLTPDTSVNSLASKHRTSSLSVKTISSPVSIGSPRPLDRSDCHDQSPPGVANLPGWTERNTGPTFALISLEEARAQRMRSATTNPPSRMSSATADSSTPFPAGDGENSDNIESSSSAIFTSRARGRSVSAGARAKNALQTIVGQPKMERRDSEPMVAAQSPSTGPPGGRTIKHKKSGFMRLFNAGKEKDGQEYPPPVPSLPDTVNQQTAPKMSITRRPVPSLSPSLMQSAGVPSNDPLLSESNSWARNYTGPTKRNLPSLSINTASQASTRASTSAVAENYMGLTLSRPWTNDQPQSAPPNVAEFPALKLRPVSTLFSAHFGDHIVTPESRSSGETTDDPDTPRSPSPNGLVFPVTPGSYTRTSNDQPQITSVSSIDDQSVVKSLQEQMASAKKAWQRHIWELEGQVRDLKAEVQLLKAKGDDLYCDKCERGKREAPQSAPVTVGVVNRPRARTGTSSRFTNALP